MAGLKMFGHAVRSDTTGTDADGIPDHFQASPVRSKRQSLHGFEREMPDGAKRLTDKNPNLKNDHFCTPIF